MDQCSFTFGKNGPHCQQFKGHDGPHTWSSAKSMEEWNARSRPEEKNASDQRDSKKTAL